MGDSCEANRACNEVEKLIRTIAVNEGFKKFQIETNKVTMDGSNYMGDLYLADVIESGKETLKLFIKAANTSEQARVMISANEIYKTEVFMYTTMADTFNELQEKFDVPNENKFIFPKYYGSSFNEMKELLVLENLAAQGYEVIDRLKPIDWEHAKAAVTEIAKFHALSFALEKDNPELFDKLIKTRPYPYADNVQGLMDTMKLGIPIALRVIEPVYRSKINKYISDNKDKWLQRMIEPSKHTTLIHCDYRMSNIMVKYQDNRLVSLKPVDYQTVYYGSPIVDLLYFLFTGSDAEFRRKHFEDFFQHYHDTLTAQLKLLSQDVNDIYPRSSFYFDLKDKLLLGLEVGLVTLGIVLVDPNDVINLEDILNVGPTPTDIFKPSDTYVERVNGIVSDFVKWGLLSNEDIALDNSANVDVKDLKLVKNDDK